MNAPPLLRARTILCASAALVLGAFAPDTALGQGNSPGKGQGGGATVQVIEPGTATPPYIWFEPDGRTFYGATQPVTVHFCDAEQIASGSTRIWLNGTLITHTVAAGAGGACNVHRVATVNLTFPAGTSKVKARACETSQTSSCANDSTYYTFTTPDPVKPTIQVSPPGGSYTQATANGVRLTWCDDYKLNMATRQVWLNGVPVATDTVAVTRTADCHSARASDLNLSLLPGGNQLKAVVRDSAGNLSDTARATFTYAPRLTLVTPDGVRRPAMCEAECFEATLAYTTPAYVSLDQPRSEALLYSSAHAQPRGFVQLDLSNDPNAVPSSVGLRLVRSDGVAEPLLGGSETTVYYAGTGGTQRLAAWFDASALATGTYRYRAEVTRSYPGGVQTDTLGVRVVIVNRLNSVYGAGWSLAGLQRIVVPTGAMDPSGVTLVDGSGNAAFFRTSYGCGATGTCTYASPAGEFTTLTRTDGGYVRLGVAGDSSVFDLSGRLLRMVDPSGNTIGVSYYEVNCAWCMMGEVSSIQDPTGNFWALTYRPAESLFGSFILNGGATVTATALYSGRDLAAVQENGGAYALSNATYTNHRLTGYTDRGGNRTDLAYDRWGKVASVIGPVYRAQGSSAWRDTLGLRSQELAVLPALGTGTYAAPAQAIRPDTVFTWATSVRGDTTRIRVDGWGAAVETRSPRGYTTYAQRNANGLVTWSRDPRGNTDSLAWDGPRLTSRTPNGDPARAVYMEYWGPGQRLSRVYGNTPESRYHYTTTAGGRVLLDSVHVAGAGMTRYTYDGRGRPLTQADSAGHSVTIAYEPGGWQNTRSVTTAGARTNQVTAWDAWGRPATTVTPDGQSTTTAYDGLGRAVTVTEPDGGITRFHYGAVFLDSLTDAKGQVYRWTRNQLGWLERAISPGDAPGQHREAVYDRYGRYTTLTDRRGVVTSYTYDRWDRPTHVSTTHPSIPNRVRTYGYSPDAPGHAAAPSWMVVAQGTIFATESRDSLVYDAEGRMTQALTYRPYGAAGWMAYEVAHTYSAAGVPDTIRYRVGSGAWRSMRMQTSASTMQLSSLRDFSGGVTYLNYNGEGALTSVNLPNGVSASFIYTSNHALSRVSYSASALNSVAGLGYLYDVANRIASRTNSLQNRTRDYLYDPTGRLQQVTDEQRSSSHSGCYLEENTGWVCPEDQQWTITAQRVFSYDKVGNPTDQGAQTQPGNRLTAYRGWTMQYDAEGFLISRSNGSQTYTYVWDGFGQLAEVRLNGATTAAYGYDGFGRRVSKQRPDGWSSEYYVYDGDDVLLDLFWDGSVAAEYTYYPGTDQVHSVLKGGARYYYAADREGSVLALVDAGGSVTSQYSYDSFGGAEYVSEGVANRLRWIGREWDQDAGLYYVRARWYEPTLQRFISEDPIGLTGGVNMYAYASNDPVNLSDRSGLLIAECGWEEYKAGKCDAYTLPGVTAVWNPFGASLMSLRFHAMMAGARACERWRCGDGFPFQQIFSICDHDSNCAPTLRYPQAGEPARIARAMRQARDDGYCGEAKRQAQRIIDANLLKIFTYDLKDGGLPVFGEAPQMQTPNGLQNLIYLHVGSINAPTILHEAMHGLPYRVSVDGAVRQRRDFTAHSDRIESLPGAPTMRDAAFICAGQQPPRPRR